MLVIAHHFIHNPDLFWSTAQKLTTDSAVPQNLKLHSVFPSKDGKTGTCVWEAESPNEVQEWLDSTLGKYAKNTTYQVNEESGLGLPERMAGSREVTV